MGFVEQVFIALLAVAALAIYSSLSFNTPMYSDGLLYADIIKHISQTGNLVGTHPHQAVTFDKNLPIFYPQLFFVEVAILNLILIKGELAFDLVQSIPGMLFILSAYLLARHIGGSKVAFLSSIILLGNFYLMQFAGSRFKADLTLYFLMVLFLYSFYRSLENKKTRWTLLSIVLMAGSLGTKQQSYFLIILMIAVLVVALSVQNWETYRATLLNGLTVLFGGLALGFPVLFYQFYTTGTFLYPSNAPYFLVQIEQDIAQVLGVTRYELNPAYLKYIKYSGYGLTRIQLSESPREILNFLSGSYPDPQLQHVFTSFFPVFFCFGLARVLKERSNRILFVLSNLLVLTFIYVFLFQSREHIFILGVFSSIILSYGVLTTCTSFVASHKRKLVYLVFLVLVIGTLLSTWSSYNYFYGVATDQKLKMGELQRAGLWIENNTPPDAIILTSRDGEVSYYSNRRTIWLNMIGGTEVYEAFNYGDEDELIQAMVKHHISYILVPKYWVGDPISWVGFMSEQMVETIENSANFKEIYNTEYVSLYMLVTTTSFVSEELRYDCLGKGQAVGEELAQETSNIDATDFTRIILAGVLIFLLPGMTWTFKFFRRGEMQLIERGIISAALSMVMLPLTIFCVNLLFGVRINLVNSLLAALLLAVAPVAGSVAHRRLRNLFLRCLHSDAI